MIRINLLPYREKEKIEDITRQIMIIGIAFVGFVLAIGAYHVYLTMSISSLDENIKKQQIELDRLNKIISDIDVFKRDKAILEKKLGIINNLEENRLAPVRMLDELTTMVPVRDVWLEKLTEKKTGITIEGMARNNIAVAHFMKNLAGSTFIKTVDLVSTKEKEVAGIKLQHFIISCEKKKG